MKTKLLLAFFAVYCLTAKSQIVDKTVYDNVYYFLTSTTLQQCSGDGTVPKATVVTSDISPGVQFKVTKILDNGDFVIHILTATKESSVVKNVELFNKTYVMRPAQNKQTKVDQKQKLDSSGTGDNSPPGATVTQDGGGTYIYLLLPAKTFNSSCDIQIKKNAFALGALTLPIKIRPGEKLSNGNYRDFAFESDISIGLSIGYKYTANKHDAFNVLTGIDLTSVPVTPTSTNNAVTTATNLSALTWHLGVLFQIDNFQVGAFTGIDYLAGNTGRQWEYRNDMWLGIGIGYSIFSPKKTSDTQ